MATELTVTAKTSNSATLAVTDIPAGGTVEIQIGLNADFAGLSTTRSYAASPVVIEGLNQGGVYFARSRGVSAGGDAEPWGQARAFFTPVQELADMTPAAVMIQPAMLVVPAPIISFAATKVIDGYPADNLGRDAPGLVYRADDESTVITFETAGAPADTVALLDTNLSEAATWRVTAANSQEDATAAPLFDTGVLPFRASANLEQRPGYHGLLRLAAPQAYPWWAITIGGAGAAQQGRIAARYLVTGRARTAKNISADKTEAVLDLGSIARRRDGGPDRVWGHRMRKVDFEISVMSEMQWETQFGDLRWKTGLSDPVLVVPNSKAGAFLHDRILFGTIAQNRANQVNSPLFTQSFSVESLI